MKVLLDISESRLNSEVWTLNSDWDEYVSICFNLQSLSTHFVVWTGKMTTLHLYSYPSLALIILKLHLGNIWIFHFVWLALFNYRHSKNVSLERCYTPISIRSQYTETCIRLVILYVGIGITQWAVRAWCVFWTCDLLIQLTVAGPVSTGQWHLTTQATISNQLQVIVTHTHIIN